eukprot:4464560-Lingulodinium_polyedra.AAC.1
MASPAFRSPTLSSNAPTVRYSPRARVSLDAAGLPVCCWPFAVQHATLMDNFAFGGVGVSP